MDKKKYNQYLKMAGFLNYVLPMIITPKQYQLCKKYFAAGLTLDELQQLAEK